MFFKESSLPKKKLKEVRRVKEILEKNLNIEIKFENDSILFESDSTFSINVFEEFLRALNAGFPLKDALKIVTENFIIKEIDVERFTGKDKKHKRRMIARVIGREGSAKRTIEEMTSTKIVIGDRMVYIMGLPDDVSLAVEALEEILKGRKHSTAYRRIRKRARWRKLERKYGALT